MWTTDGAGDLINLDKVEAISIYGQEDPDVGWTHELLALLPSGESYVLLTGTLDECKVRRTSLLTRLYDYATKART